MKGLSKKIYNYNFYLFIGKYMLNDSQNNEKETFEFIKTLSDDNQKIQYLNKINNEEYKFEIIISLSSDDKKIQCLDKLTDECLKASVIARLNGDEKKIQFLDEINDEEYKTRIIQLLSNDDKKIQCLDKLNEELLKAFVIETLSDDDKKFQYLDKLTDEKNKVFIILKLSEDYKKIYCLDKLNSEEYKTVVIETLSDDDKKIYCLDKLNSDYYKTVVIGTLSDEEKKIQFLDKFDDENKCKIINSFETDEKRILLMNMCITDKYYWSDVIANLKLFESDGYLVAKKFADYIVSNNYEITYELIKSEKDKYMPIFERITLSNSMEIQNIDIKGLISVYNSDESIDKKEFNKKIDSIENIFLKNNLPPYAKTYLCFRSIYPEFSKKYSGRELFDFEDKSRMAPSLLDSSMDKIFDNKIGLYFSKPNDKRFVTISNDLFNISLKSNNFELKEYIENLEIGNNLLNKIIMNEVDYNSLNEKEKFQYDMFSSHIDMLYEISNKNKLDKNFNNEKEKLEFIKNEFVGKGKYSLLDSITRYYLYFAGYKSFNQLKNDVFNECNLINEKNSKDVIENFKISQGDLIRCIGNIDCIGSVLNYGNVCKEYLGTFTGKSESDTTPLDTDWTYITEDDISNNNYNTISGTPTGFGFGDVFVIIKDVKNNPNIEISRDIDGKVRDFK